MELLKDLRCNMVARCALLKKYQIILFLSFIQVTCTNLAMSNCPVYRCRFQANMAAYQNLITKSMYDKQLDSGKGSLLHLCDDVVQQEVSLFLAFYSCVFLLLYFKVWEILYIRGNKRSKHTCGEIIARFATECGTKLGTG